MDASPPSIHPSSNSMVPSVQAKPPPLRAKIEPFEAVNSLLEASKISAILSPVATESINSTISPLDETFNSVAESERRKLPFSPLIEAATGKRKLCQVEEEPSPFGRTPTSRRKGSEFFLRKGQWTETEEKLTMKLIEAFEAGYLPISTGIRLRGYLAVQLQCDPMRVSKKLCAGTIDGKTIPKNFGQRKFILRDKLFWDCKTASRIVAQLEELTKVMWSESRLKRPPFLTLSSTRNVEIRRGLKDKLESVSSPPSSAKRAPSPPTSRAKKPKMFPVIYLSLSKRSKKYPCNDLNDDSSDAASPSDSDIEPVHLDGESLQAAYDLLTLCRPDASIRKTNGRGN